MGNPRKINLSGFITTSVTRYYYLKHKVTGEYADGVYFHDVLSHVPGKARRQRISKAYIHITTTPVHLDMHSVNSIINRAIKEQISSQLDNFDLLTVDRVVGVVPVGKLDLKKKKDAAEMAFLVNKLKGTV